MNFVYLGVAIYVVGLISWFLLWGRIIGYDWLRTEPLLHIALWGGAATFLINAVLTAIAQVPEYGIEIGIYSFVENNAKTVAGFTLGIAVFVVVTFQKTVSLEQEESRQFLKLVFTSFLFSVVGVLPLYWVPQVFGWLTTLRHLKTVPYLYSLFILAAAMLIYIHEVKTAEPISEDSQEQSAEVEE
ncbi:MAG: hypothetical protein ACYTGS_13490 [Planctomycetota bacterium]|jgi:hypothetical protein